MIAITEAGLMGVDVAYERESLMNNLLVGVPIANHLMPRMNDAETGIIRVSNRGWNVNVALDDSIDFPRLTAALRSWLKGDWSNGGVVDVEVGARISQIQQLSSIRNIFEVEFGLSISSFWCDPKSIERSGINPGTSVQANETYALQVQRSRNDRPAPLWLKSTCRSGVHIEHHGDVIVWGDVNPGSMVSATGDVLIFGTLRGIAHAGMDLVDPRGSVVVALSLRALQVRIGPFITTPGKSLDRKGRFNPKIAYSENGSIVIDTYRGDLTQRLIEGGSDDR